MGTDWLAVMVPLLTIPMFSNEPEPWMVLELVSVSVLAAPVMMLLALLERLILPGPAERHVAGDFQLGVATVAIEADGSGVH
jgi:hypothetical protein